MPRQKDQTMTTLTVKHVADRNDLHCQYPGQTSAQPCYVELDCESATLRAAYNPEIGNGIPFAVHHGRTLRWSIAALTADVANALLDELAPLAQRVVDGFEAVWDGNNMVGQLDADASAASEEIDETIRRGYDRSSADEHDTVSVWQACDWYGPLGSTSVQCRELGITADTTDDQLAEIERRENGNAEGAEIEGHGRYLAELRSEARAAREVA